MSNIGVIGNMKNWDRIKLIRLYFVAVAVYVDGIVEQLIRIGAAGAEVDRGGIARDISRLLK